MTGNNPNLDLADINAYLKFGEIPSIRSKILCGKENLISIKGHNSVTNLRKKCLASTLSSVCVLR